MNNKIETRKGIELDVSNIMVNEKQGTMTVTLNASQEDKNSPDCVEITGLLYTMMDAIKKIHQDSQEVEPPKIKKSEGGHWRKWTPEEIERARETRLKNQLADKYSTKENKKTDQTQLTKK
jgi:hypothetical protein